MQNIFLLVWYKSARDENFYENYFQSNCKNFNISPKNFHPLHKDIHRDIFYMFPYIAYVFNVHKSDEKSFLLPVM